MQSEVIHSERTPLRTAGDANPPYVFMTNPNRAYRKKIREFQCCICSSILIVVAVAILAALTYSLDKDENNNSTTPLPPSNDSINTLLTLSWPIKDQQRFKVMSKSPTDQEFEKALKFGLEQLKLRDNMDDLTPSLKTSSPSFKHQQVMTTNAIATKLARIGYAINKATENLTSIHPNLKASDLLENKVPINEEWLPPDWCGHETTPCSPSKYRSIDGSCNNLKYPQMWGVGFRPFRRVLPAEYCDGISTPRCAVDRGPLPSAREISVTIHRPVYRYDMKFTVMLAVWGQLIDHDITATALSKGEGGKAISCCGVPPCVLHPECFPVQITDNDPYYHMYNTTCMEFTRSAPSPTCSLGPREQMNQVSSYLDGSVIYGNTKELSDGLRTFENGLLKMSLSPDGRPLLPVSKDYKDGCNRREENAKGRYCFSSGDPRANENLHLTSIHLLLARQHNRIAQELKIINPNWNDEKLYQESRRILGAQMQHITYNEFVGILLGPEMMETLELYPLKSGYTSNYNDSIDASIANSFAASAFRFAHTLLPGLMKMTSNRNSVEYIELHKMLFNPFSLYTPGSLDNALNGAMDTQLERSDNYFNKELTEHLFEGTYRPGKPKVCGLDLVSLNIQRGRDHGLPGYTTFREHCQLSKPKEFYDLKGQMDNDSLRRIVLSYKTVDDVDIYTGALSEIPIPGGLLGPTAMCLIADQFTRLKLGDRYWYETNEEPHAFTEDQLDEIRKTTLARIICDNADDVSEIQPFVMKSKAKGNQRIHCSKIPQLNFQYWKEEAVNQL